MTEHYWDDCSVVYSCPHYPKCNRENKMPERTRAVPTSLLESPRVHGQENTCLNCAHRIYWEDTYKVWRHLDTYDYQCKDLRI
jgi:hypothetical protein